MKRERSLKKVEEFAVIPATERKTGHTGEKAWGRRCCMIPCLMQSWCNLGLCATSTTPPTHTHTHAQNITTRNKRLERAKKAKKAPVMF